MMKTAFFYGFFFETRLVSNLSMFSLIQLILGSLISAFAAYYWYHWGSEVRTEFLPLWARFSFRTLPSSDYIITLLGSFLFLNGLLQSYRRYSARFAQLGPDPTESLYSQGEMRRENKLRQKLFFKIIYYPLVMTFIIFCISAPFLKWSYLTSAAQEFFVYKTAHYSLGSPVWGIWIFSSWGAGLLSLGYLTLKKRLSLKVMNFTIPYFLNWILFQVSLPFDLYTHIKHPGAALSMIGILGLTLLALLDAFLMRRE